MAKTFDNGKKFILCQPVCNVFGLQVHPEVVHTPRGKEIIQNFVYEICGCKMDWTMGSFMSAAMA